MVSLVDLGPSKAVVPMRGQEVEVNGLTAEHIVGVLYAFPEVRKLLIQQEVDIATLVAKFPQAIALVIAAGTGHPEDQQHIDAARALNVGEQYDLVKKIVELTFPNGLQPFLDGVNAAMEAAGARGWDQVTKSPVVSSVASQQDASSETAGTVRPASSEPG